MAPSNAPPTLRLYNLNVQGLTSPKFLSLLRWLREQSAHGAVLTETHLTSDPADMVSAVAGGGTIWPGMRIFHVPGTGTTGGVTVVLGPSPYITDPIQFNDHGINTRVIRLDLFFFEQASSLIGVYGPAQHTEREDFYSNVLPQFMPPLAAGRGIIMAGDFNVVASDLDCWYADYHHPPIGPNTRLIGLAPLQHTMDGHGLHDVWREANPVTIATTHMCYNGFSGARLDRFLLSTSFSDSFEHPVATIEAAAPIRTDHRPVALTFRAPKDTIPRGHGISGFPLAIFNIPAAMAQLHSFICSESAAVLASPTIACWVNAKARIMAEAYKIYSSHRRARQLAARKAQADASAAESALKLNDNAALHARLFSKLKSARNLVITAWDNLLAPAAQAGRHLDHLFAEAGTYYFHQQARPLHPATVVRKLNRPGRDLDGGGADTADLSTRGGTAQALAYAADYYTSASPIGLFRIRDTDAAVQDELISTVRSLPPWLEPAAEGPDRDSLLTTEELQVAFRAAGRGTVPGRDGIPYEVYRAFSAQFLPVIKAVFNGAFLAARQHIADHPGEDIRHHSPLSRLLISVICLLYKGDGKPRDELEEGYRPITLLDCDVKIVMLVISSRLQLPLDFLIDDTQSAYISGRDIGDNVRYHLGLATRLQELGSPAWLLYSDLSKAYDKTDRMLLFRLMRSMGFRASGVTLWCRLLLNGSSACVRVNGFFSSSFAIKSNIPQGSSLSCMQWVIVAQLAFSVLSREQLNGRLSSFPLPSGAPAPPACAYADDITAPVLQPEELKPVVKDAFDRLAKAGLPEQSVPKTGLQHLCGDRPPSMDPGLHNTHLPTGYRIFNAAESADLRHLGVPMAPHLHIRQKAAFSNMRGKIIAAARTWSHVQSTRIGLAHVANQSLLSKPVYQALFHLPSEEQRQEIQTTVNRFVANAPRPEERGPNSSCLFPSAKVCSLHPQQGGLGILDVEAQFPSLIAKPCWRVFSYSHHPWADLFGNEVARATTTDNGQRTTGNGQEPASQGWVTQGEYLIPPGAHWIVTCPDAGLHFLDAISTASYKQSVEAFLSIGIRRLQPLANMDRQAILLESTFHNAAAASSSPSDNARSKGHQSSDLTSPLARSWRRLRDVRAAHLDRPRLTTPETRDLDMIIAALPEPWRAAVTGYLPDPPPLWREVSAPGADLVIIEGPDNETHLPVLWHLIPASGILVRITTDIDQAELHGSRAVLVVHKPKPCLAWDRADYDRVREQQQLPPADRKELLQPMLVGYWDRLQLDPRVWGISASPSPDQDDNDQDPPDQDDNEPRRNNGANISLLDMTVRAVRRLLAGRLALKRGIPGLAQAGATRPATWPASGSPQDPPTTTTATTPDSLLRSLGLPGLEERWRRPLTQASDLDHWPEADTDIVPPWLDLNRPSSSAAPSLRAARSAARGSVLPLVQSGQHMTTDNAPTATTDYTSKNDYVGVWRRLSDPTLHRPFRVTAWSILHGTIGCNAFMFHILRQGRSSNFQEEMRLCRSPACTAAGRSEDITHAFLSCPDILPAIDWLLNAWAALAGLDRPPPKTAALLLADDINAWPEDIRPSGPAYRLWTRLRVNVLGAIWQVRCSRGEAAGGGGRVQQGVGVAAAQLAASGVGGDNGGGRGEQPAAGATTGFLAAGLSTSILGGAGGEQHSGGAAAGQLSAGVAGRVSGGGGGDQTTTGATTDLQADGNSPGVHGGATGEQQGDGLSAGLLAAGLAGGVHEGGGRGQPAAGIAEGHLTGGLAADFDEGLGATTTQHQSVSRQIITIAVEHIVEAIQRDWLRSHTDIRTLDNGAFCPAWWRGTDTKIKRQQFLDRWSKPPFLCQLKDQDDDAAVSLHMSIGVDKPIMFPP